MHGQSARCGHNTNLFSDLSKEKRGPLHENLHDSGTPKKHAVLFILRELPHRQRRVADRVGVAHKQQLRDDLHRHTAAESHVHTRDGRDSASTPSQHSDAHGTRTAAWSGSRHGPATAVMDMKVAATYRRHALAAPHERSDRGSSVTCRQPSTSGVCGVTTRWQRGTDAAEATRGMSAE